MFLAILQSQHGAD